MVLENNESENRANLDTIDDTLALTFTPATISGLNPHSINNRVALYVSGEAGTEHSELYRLSVGQMSSVATSLVRYVLSEYDKILRNDLDRRFGNLMADQTPIAENSDYQPFLARLSEIAGIEGRPWGIKFNYDVTRLVENGSESDAQEFTKDQKLAFEARVMELLGPQETYRVMNPLPQDGN